ncbi:hypothetical protein DEO72_LG3g1898 [Vigna unguiculata]|uniref:Uncharacterized protein n=1 Tax=Vigna unguiculata TaxID=3917 RepID=A0A4D6LGU1_VIGUN|nr:hypothetical protein DEO72_LG3g1898 [Vigna unguiculata]
MKDDDKLSWWTDFKVKAKVTWAPQDEWQIKKVCESKVRKRLFDLLSKVRVKKDKDVYKRHYAAYTPDYGYHHERWCASKRDRCVNYDALTDTLYIMID